jgi:hypothetical protein
VEVERGVLCISGAAVHARTTNIPAHRVLPAVAQLISERCGVSCCPLHTHVDCY